MGMDRFVRLRNACLGHRDRLGCYQIVPVADRLAAKAETGPSDCRNKSKLPQRLGFLAMLWPRFAFVWLNIADDKVLDGVTRLQRCREPARLLSPP